MYNILWAKKGPAWSTAYTEVTFKPSSFLLVNAMNLRDNLEPSVETCAEITEFQTRIFFVIESHTKPFSC